MAARGKSAWTAETLWQLAAQWAGQPASRFGQMLAASAWLREIGERDGADALRAVQLALASDATTPPGELLNVAPDLNLASGLRSIVQSRLRHHENEVNAQGERILFRHWSDFHLYARFAAVPIGRELDGVGDDAALSAVDTLMTASLLAAYAIDAPAVWRRDKRLLLPQQWLAQSGAAAGDLGKSAANAGMRGAYLTLTRRIDDLLAQAAPAIGRMPTGPSRRYLRILMTLTKRLAARLTRRDPLAERLEPGLIDRALCWLVR